VTQDTPSTFMSTPMDQVPGSMALQNSQKSGHLAWRKLRVPDVCILHSCRLSEAIWGRRRRREVSYSIHECLFRKYNEDEGVIKQALDFSNLCPCYLIWKTICRHAQYDMSLSSSIWKAEGETGESLGIQRQPGLQKSARPARIT
jgi:hypothetical protein